MDTSAPLIDSSKKIHALVITIVCILVLTCAGIFYFYKHEQRVGDQHDRQVLKLMADNLASDHEGSIYGIRQFLISSGYLVEQVDLNEDTCPGILRRVHVVYPYFLNVGITDSSGAVICSGVEIGTVINIGGDEDFIEARESQKFTVSGYRLSAITGRPSVRFSQPIIKDGEFSGVLFVSFATEWLNGFSPSFDPPQGSVITKFDKDGIVFFRYPNPLTWSGTDQQDSDLFQEISKQKIGYFTVRGLEGNERLYYFRPIYQEGKIHAYIAVGRGKF